MKITKTQLRRIIKEELSHVMHENDGSNVSTLALAIVEIGNVLSDGGYSYDGEFEGDVDELMYENPDLIKKSHESALRSLAQEANTHQLYKPVLSWLMKNVHPDSKQYTDPQMAAAMLDSTLEMIGSMFKQM